MGYRGKHTTIIVLNKHWDKINPNYISQYPKIGTPQPTSVKLLFSVDENCHKDPQLDNMQRVRDFRVLITKWDFFLYHTFSLMA